MLTGDLTAYYEHAVAHPTRYNNVRSHGLPTFAKVAAVAFVFGAVVTSVLFTWYRSTQVPRLMAQLQSEDEAVWQGALENLIAMGPRSVPALVQAVAGDNEALGKRALLGLERLGDGAVERLVSLLSGGDEVVGELAARVLVQVSSADSVPHLMRQYRDTESAEVRLAIIEVFAKHPGLRLIDVLVGSLSPESESAGAQALNLKVDALCRSILTQAAEQHPDAAVPQPPEKLEDWPTWFKEHRSELRELRRATSAEQAP